MASADTTLLFKRSQFATRLPLDCSYNPSHFWARQGKDGMWRVGFTKFATRMLGDMVDHDFEMKAGASMGRMPENVSVRLRAMVTAGLAKDVEAVNQ